KGIAFPTGGSPIAVAYTNTTVTKTQGNAWLKESYDAWGRLERIEERVQGTLIARTDLSYNALGHQIGETIPAGASYSMSYDIWDRPRTRSASGDSHSFSYATNAQGLSTTTSVKNGTVTTVLTKDIWDRITYGAT